MDDFTDQKLERSRLCDPISEYLEGDDLDSPLKLFDHGDAILGILSKPGMKHRSNRSSMPQGFNHLDFSGPSCGSQRQKSTAPLHRSPRSPADNTDFDSFHQL